MVICIVCTHEHFSGINDGLCTDDNCGCTINGMEINGCKCYKCDKFCIKADELENGTYVCDGCYTEEVYKNICLVSKCNSRAYPCHYGKVDGRCTSHILISIIRVFTVKGDDHTFEISSDKKIIDLMRMVLEYFKFSHSNKYCLAITKREDVDYTELPKIGKPTNPSYKRCVLGMQIGRYGLGGKIEMILVKEGSHIGI